MALFSRLTYFNDGLVLSDLNLMIFKNLHKTLESNNLELVEKSESKLQTIARIAHRVLQLGFRQMDLGIP